MYNIFTSLFIKDLTFDVMIWHYYLHGYTEVNEYKIKHKTMTEYL